MTAIKLYTLALCTVFAFTDIASAGGIVLEDTAESAPVVQPKRHNALPWIIGAVIIGGLLLGGGGSDVCHGDEVPTPEPGPC